MSTVLTRKALEALVEGARIADDEGDILRKRGGQWFLESSAFSQAPISEDVVMWWSPKLISDGPTEPEPAAPIEVQADEAYEPWREHYLEGFSDHTHREAFRAGFRAGRA